jgi:hypothetical protein
MGVRVLLRGPILFGFWLAVNWLARKQGNVRNGVLDWRRRPRSCNLVESRRQRRRGGELLLLFFFCHDARHILMVVPGTPIHFQVVECVT